MHQWQVWTSDQPLNEYSFPSLFYFLKCENFGDQVTGRTIFQKLRGMALLQLRVLRLLRRNSFLFFLFISLFSISPRLWQFDFGFHNTARREVKFKTRRFIFTKGMVYPNIIPWSERQTHTCTFGWRNWQESETKHGWIINESFFRCCFNEIKEIWNCLPYLLYSEASLKWHCWDQNKKSCYKELKLKRGNQKWGKGSKVHQECNYMTCRPSEFDISTFHFSHAHLWLWIKCPLQYRG